MKLGRPSANAGLKKEAAMTTGKGMAVGSSPVEETAIGTALTLRERVAKDVLASTIQIDAERQSLPDDTEEKSGDCNSISQTFEQVSNTAAVLCTVCQIVADTDVGVCVACGSTVHTMCSINLDVQVDNLQALICLLCHEEGYDVDRVMPDLLRKI